METPNVKRQVVTHLKRLLAEAEAGKITSFAAVTFGPNDYVGYDGEFTEAADTAQAVRRIGELQRQVQELQSSAH